MIERGRRELESKRERERKKESKTNSKTRLIKGKDLTKKKKLFMLYTYLDKIDKKCKNWNKSEKNLRIKF